MSSGVVGQLIREYFSMRSAISQERQQRSVLALQSSKVGDVSGAWGRREA